MLTRSLQCTRLLLPNRMLSPLQMAHFSKWLPTDNTPNIPPKMMEEEKRLFMERCSEKKKALLALDRMLTSRLDQDYIRDENAWWNKLQAMTEDEIRMMPMGFIKKYGSYITNLQRYYSDWKMDENKNMRDYYSQVKFLKKLQTDEEKSLMLKEYQRLFEPDIVTMKDLERNPGDYMRR